MRTPTTVMLILFSVLISLAAADDSPPVKPAAESPPASDNANDFEPEITIIQKDNAIYEEHRMHGDLYMIKVTPKHWAPYYLVDRDGRGDFIRSEYDAESSIPMWVIKEF